VFHDFFTCGLRFPCNPLVPAILDKILWRFINYHRVCFRSCPSFSGLWRSSGVTWVLMCSHDCSI
jgi:hypothetical protein